MTAPMSQFMVLPYWLPWMLLILTVLILVWPSKLADSLHVDLHLHKVSGPNLVTYLNRTPTFEWCVVRYGSNNRDIRAWPTCNVLKGF